VDPRPEFINTQENGVIRASGLVTNHDVHVYSEWLNRYAETWRLPYGGEVDHEIVREPVPPAKVEVAQRFRVALGNLQTLTGRL
jgi:hypothetical protein